MGQLTDSSDMLIYLIVFLLSIFFTRLCEVSEKKIFCFSFATISVLIPALLAGLRDYGVGHDTTIYVDFTYREILEYKDASLWSFLKATMAGEFTQEPFYCFLNYMGLQLGPEVNYVYFVVSLVTMALAFNAIFLYREKASMPFMMFVFLFLYFNVSLNIIRQTVALALALNVFMYLERRQWIVSCLFLVLMLLSHTTSVVFLLFLMLYVAVMRGAAKKVVFVLLLLVPVSLLLLDELILLAISVNIVPMRFMEYMIEEDETVVMKTAVAFGWLVLGTMLWYGRSLLKKDETSREIVFIFNVKLFSNLLTLASVVSQWAFRMAFYFGIFDVLFIPRAVRLISEEDEKRGKLLTVCFIALIVFYWYWSVIHNNENETYPYKSELLGI